MKLSSIENIIANKTENIFGIELSRLSKDMAFPMMIIRRCVRTCCENNNIIDMLNETRWNNICNFLYEKYVK